MWTCSATSEDSSMPNSTPPHTPPSNSRLLVDVHHASDDGSQDGQDDEIEKLDSGIADGHSLRCRRQTSQFRAAASTGEADIDGDAALLTPQRPFCTALHISSQPPRLPLDLSPPFTGLRPASRSDSVYSENELGLIANEFPRPPQSCPLFVKPRLSIECSVKNGQWARRPLAPSTDQATHGIRQRDKETLVTRSHDRPPLSSPKDLGPLPLPPSPPSSSSSSSRSKSSKSSNFPTDFFVKSSRPRLSSIDVDRASAEVLIKAFVDSVYDMQLAHVGLLAYLQHDLATKSGKKAAQDPSTHDSAASRVSDAATSSAGDSHPTTTTAAKARRDLMSPAGNLLSAPGRSHQRDSTSTDLSTSVASFWSVESQQLCSSSIGSVTTASPTLDEHYFSPHVCTPTSPTWSDTTAGCTAVPSSTLCLAAAQDKAHKAQESEEETLFRALQTAVGKGLEAVVLLKAFGAGRARSLPAANGADEQPSAASTASDTRASSDARSEVPLRSSSLPSASVCEGEASTSPSVSEADKDSVAATDVDPTVDRQASSQSSYSSIQNSSSSDGASAAIPSLSLSVPSQEATKPDSVTTYPPSPPSSVPPRGGETTTNPKPPGSFYTHPRSLRFEQAKAKAPTRRRRPVTPYPSLPTGGNPLPFGAGTLWALTSVVSKSISGAGGRTPSSIKGGKGGLVQSSPVVVKTVEEEKRGVEDVEEKKEEVREEEEEESGRRRRKRKPSLSSLWKRTVATFSAAAGA